MSALRIILGDQLSLNISSLRDVDLKKDLILMCELKQEATYVKHHKKKIAFLFSAMRHFAKTLREKNFQLHYTEYNDPQNTGSFTEEIQRLLKNHDFKKIIITEPGEHRVLRGIQRWSQDLKLPVVIYPDDRFLCSTEDFSAWAKDRKQCRMEFFYRHMRKLHNILMDGDKPIGGKWNYDIEAPPTKSLRPF